MSTTTATLFTGAKLPLIGLGTWKSEKGLVQKAVVAALEAGYRHIDCAAAYGNEAEVGAGIADAIARGVVKREDIFVTSKLWVSKCSPEMVAGALEQTLKDLGLAYLDLFLLHWPFFMKAGAAFPPATRADMLGYSESSYLAVWREMEAAVDAGKTRHIGCSNMSAKKIAALLASARIQPAVNQVESHPFLPQTALLAFCTAHKIVLQAYSPLGSPDRPARLIADSDPVPLADPVVAAVAAKHGVGAGAVLLRWQVQRGVVALPKSTTPSRIADNLNVFGFALDADDLAQLATLAQRAGGNRIVKGLPFMSEGMADWRELWDEDWEAKNVALLPAA